MSLVRANLSMHFRHGGPSRTPYNKRMQLSARGLRLARASVRRLGLRSARAARLRNEPPGGVRWVHGGRQLMRKPLYGSKRHERVCFQHMPYSSAGLAEGAFYRW
jgi:hypothetical protein